MRYVSRGNIDDVRVELMVPRELIMLLLIHVHHWLLLMEYVRIVLIDGLSLFLNLLDFVLIVVLQPLHLLILLFCKNFCLLKLLLKMPNPISHFPRLTYAQRSLIHGSLDLLLLLALDCLLLYLCLGLL